MLVLNFQILQGSVAM